MGRIKNKNKYLIKENPSNEDYVIGSDSENDGKTVNFRVGSLTGETSASDIAIGTSDSTDMANGSAIIQSEIDQLNFYDKHFDVQEFPNGSGSTDLVPYVKLSKGITDSIDQLESEVNELNATVSELDNSVDILTVIVEGLDDQVQSDWNASGSSNPATILNKPNLGLYHPQAAVSINTSTAPSTHNINMNASSGTYYVDRPSVSLLFTLNPNPLTPEGYIQKIFIKKDCNDVTVTAPTPFIGLPALVNTPVQKETLLEFVYEDSNWIRIK